MSDPNTNDNDEKTELRSLRDLKLDQKLSLLLAFIAIVVSVSALILQRISDKEQAALQTEQLQFERNVQIWARDVRATDSAQQDVIRSTIESQTEAQILLQKTLVASQHAQASSQQTQVAVEADLRGLYERSEFPLIRVIASNTKFLLEDISWDPTNGALIQRGRIGVLIENEGGGSTILTSVRLQSSVDNGLGMKGVHASAVSSVNTLQSAEPISSLPLQIEARSGVSLTVQWEQSIPPEFVRFDPRTLLGRLVASEGRVAAVDPSLVLSFSNGDRQKIQLNEADLDYSPLIRKLPEITGRSETVGGICFLWTSTDGTKLVEIAGSRLLTGVSVEPYQCYSAPPGSYEIFQALDVDATVKRRPIASIEAVERKFRIADLTDKLISYLYQSPTPPHLPSPTPTSLPEPLSQERPLGSWSPVLFLLLPSLIVATVLVYLLPCIRVRTFGKPPDGYMLICRGSEPAEPVISLRQAGIAKCSSKITIGGDPKRSTVYFANLMRPAEFRVVREDGHTVVRHLLTGRKVELNMTPASVFTTSVPGIVVMLCLDPAELSCEKSECVKNCETARAII